MAIDYQVVEEQGALINVSFAYARNFITVNRTASSFARAYLVINASTGYDTNHANESAQVLINGVLVGSVSPTYASPGSNDPYIGTEMTLTFPHSVLALIQGVGIGINLLKIVPQGDLYDPNNWLIVNTIICTYTMG